MMKRWKTSCTLAPPSDPNESAEASKIAASMDATYGKGKYCPNGADKVVDLEELRAILRTSTDPKQRLDAWNG